MHDFKIRKEEILRNVTKSSHIPRIFSWLSSEPMSFEEDTNVNLNLYQHCLFFFHLLQFL